MSILQDAARQAVGRETWAIRRSRAGQIAGGMAKQVMVIAATLLALFPVYFMVVSAFKTKSQYLENKWGLPLQPVLENFATAFAGEKFLLRFANSLILTVTSVVLSLVIATLAAYAFARMPFAGQADLV